MRKLQSERQGFDPNRHFDQNGELVSEPTGLHFSTDWLQRETAGREWPGPPLLSDDLNQQAGLAAMNSEGHYYFANSYLVGFAPYQGAALWEPLYAVALQKSYQLDQQLYGKSDVWQNSYEAFTNVYGDCEDHALFVADWLIELGYQARVVVGEVDGDGHAWVVVTLDGVDYLIEATNKRRLKGANPYPLVISQSHYQPRFQFDRNHFWVNDGGGRATQLNGASWRLGSRFYPIASH